LKHHNQEGPTSTAEAMNSRGKMHIKTCFTYRLEQQELSADIGSNLIGFPTKPHKEIIRLYITVKKPLLMHVLNPINHLISKHEHSLQRELSAAVVEQVLKARPKKIDHHDIILPLNTKPLQVWNASCNKGEQKGQPNPSLC
jgi:hypothetical protein